MRYNTGVTGGMGMANGEIRHQIEALEEGSAICPSSPHADTGVNIGGIERRPYRIPTPIRCMEAYSTRLSGIEKGGIMGKHARKKTFVLLPLIALMIAGGCGMDGMDDNGSAYAPYEGLKLPNERQRALTNQQVGWRELGRPITAPGVYYGPAAAERGMADEDRQYNDKFFHIQALYRKGLDRMLVEEFGLDRYDREIGEQYEHFAPEDIDADFKEDAESYY